MAIQATKYNKWVAELKNNIAHSELHTALSVNRNLIIRNWYIGKQLKEKIETNNWGAKVLNALSDDLQKAFPTSNGYSLRNLKYMKQYADMYPNLLVANQAITTQKKPVLTLKHKKKVIGQQAAAQLENSENSIGQQAAAQFNNINYFVENQVLLNIPWGHIILLLDKINEPHEGVWYTQKTIENNWSRAVLKYQIETDLYTRQYKKTKATNFHLTLPKIQSDLANQIIKDPYIFSFLQLDENIKERDLELALIKHIEEFLIELGAGFAFVGRQVKFKIGKKDKFIDLLFYHLHLRCYIVFELKMEEFEWEHTGQMNGYLNVVNKQLKHIDDKPTMGIILCSGKDNIEVDYALTNINHPIGVTEYNFSKTLPKILKNKMPSAKQLQTVVKNFLKKNKITEK